MNRFTPSPNFSPGWKREPIGVIIHWTAGKYLSSVEWMLNKQARASAHWVVNFDGDRKQLVKTLDRAWHAGVSETKYGPNCNDYTFGIELVGPPSMVGLTGWDMRQLDMAAAICRMLKQRYASICFITDHSTVAPGRKIDVKKHQKPQDKFPWEQFVKMTGIPEYVP